MLTARGAHRLPAGPLDTSTIGRIIAQGLGSALPVNVLRKIRHVSGGNPLFALEAGRAIVAILALTVTAVDTLRRIPPRVATHEASSTNSSVRTAAPAPRLVSGAEARFLVRRGATSAELAAENELRWRHLQLRMLAGQSAMDLLRHRPGVSAVDLAGAYRGDGSSRKRSTMASDDDIISVSVSGKSGQRERQKGEDRARSAR